MSSGIRDSYCMNSSGVIDIYTNEQVVTNIHLDVTPDPPLILSGYVWDRPTQGKGVEMAEVSVFTPANEFLQRTYSDSAGYFEFHQLESGAYKLTASKEGMQTARFMNVLLEPGSGGLHNLVLTPLNAAENLIYGRAAVSGLQPISDARVDVFDSVGQLAASTTTAKDGAYAVYGLADGAYSLLIAAAGYGSIRLDTKVGAQSRVQNLDAALTPAIDPFPAASICGFITNQQGAALGGAWVGLYTVCENREERLAAASFSTADGFYSFGPIAAGKYLVKSKMMVG